MSQIVYISGHAAGALARLATAFASDPNLIALITAIVGNPANDTPDPTNATALQSLEDAAWQCLINRTLAAAVGTQLDTIGKIVGCPRGAAPDDNSYRLLISAQILINDSHGTSEDVIGVFRAGMGGLGKRTFTPGGIAEFSIRLDNYVSATWQIPIFVQFVEAAKEAGTYGIVEYSEDIDPNMFFTDFATFFSSGTAIGANAIPAQNTTGFPPSGSLILDVGTTQQETVAYTSITGAPAQQFNLSGTCANTHNLNAQIGLLTATGKGFDDANNPGQSYAGELAGASATSETST